MKRTITFLPEKLSVMVEKDDTILSAAAKAGVYIPASCGGDGVCGKCKVHVQGEVHSDKATLKQEDWDKGFRLACRSTAVSDLEVTIPELSTKNGKALKHRPKTTRTASAKALDSLLGTWTSNPPVFKLCLELSPPTMEDNLADMQRVMRALRHALPESVTNAEPVYDFPELLKYLPGTLRDGEWRVTFTLLHGNQNEPVRIIDVEAGDTTAKLYGLALDIGTTTCSGLLIDLRNGEVLAESSSYNDQIGLGEDVISRIIYAGRANGLKILQAKVVHTINTIIEDICQQRIISPSDIACMIAAGNTVMSHLLLGINPKYLREAPYVPSVSQFPLVKAARLGLHVHPSTRLLLYPCIASYVGGDIVSGVHACQMAKSDKISLFIDIGTNGEIVVGGQDWMACAACSAGPAFEGGGIQFGMRATAGAIEKFQIHPETFEPMIVTVGQSKPAGICGSGLIAIIAELLENNVIDRQGKFHHDLNTERIRQGKNGWEYVLVWEKNTLIGEDIVLTEVDIDNLLRAKGAMYAGYQTLLESVGLTFADLDQVILAGNFGAYLDLEQAICIGMLPDISREHFYYLGNASLLGCQISLTDRNRLQELEATRQLITNMELCENPQFMQHYMAALFLPHTDMQLFPSVQQKLSAV
jgi:uncharacterized 2Fe-2S/4Fe-4S cluster protein (DUF4445 family)